MQKINNILSYNLTDTKSNSLNNSLYLNDQAEHDYKSTDNKSWHNWNIGEYSNVMQ